MVPNINDSDFDAKLAERIRILEERAKQEKTHGGVSPVQAEKPVAAQRIQAYLFNGTQYFTNGQESMSSRRPTCQAAEDTQKTVSYFHKGDFNQSDFNQNSRYGDKFSQMYYDGNCVHLGYNPYTGMHNHKNLHTTKFLQLNWICQTSCKIGRKKVPRPTIEDILKLPVENRFWYPGKDNSAHS